MKAHFLVCIACFIKQPLILSIYFYDHSFIDIVLGPVVKRTFLCEELGKLNERFSSDRWYNMFTLYLQCE